MPQQCTVLAFDTHRRATHRRSNVPGPAILEACSRAEGDYRRVLDRVEGLRVAGARVGRDVVAAMLIAARARDGVVWVIALGPAVLAVVAREHARVCATARLGRRDLSIDAMNTID